MEYKSDWKLTLECINKKVDVFTPLDIKNEVNKDQTVRLNIDIDKAKLQKLKIYLATNDLTMKQVITDYVDSLVGNE